MSGSKGAFSADISEEAVAEALRAVEERLGGAESEPVLEVEGAETSEDGPLLDLGEDWSEGGAEAEAEDEAPFELASSPEERLAALEAELQEKDRLLEDSQRRGRETMERLQEASERLTRQAADAENFRKRAAREREEQQRFAIERLLKELVPVLDNFDRALDHASQGTDLEAFAQGVSMTRKLFEETLARFGVKAFTSVGEAFDPHLHEAMEQIESDEHEVNRVAREMLRGYLLHERLIRPALVSVSKGPGPEGGDEAPASAHEVEAPVETSGELEVEEKLSSKALKD